jgi:hypothetical protein
MATNEEINPQQRVSGPAIALLVTAILGIIAQLGNLIRVLLSAGAIQAQAQVIAQQQGQQLPAQQMQMLQYLTGTTAIVATIVGSVVGIVIIVGALKMRNLQSYGLAMTSSILAMIPCVSPCCLLGLPFGIWALVVLSKPEVKAAFRA